MLRKLTRREAANFLTQQGYPTSVHLLNRLCGPAINQGPPSSGRWGNRELYTEPKLLAWAQRRSESQRDRPRGNPGGNEAKANSSITNTEGVPVDGAQGRPAGRQPPPPRARGTGDGTTSSGMHLAAGTRQRTMTTKSN